ncbi:MAG: TIGR00725 family protein [Candidatus Zixiibacteriota bacterium]
MSEGAKILIGVIGAGKCAKKLREQAYQVGAEIAKAGAVVVCGGMKGVMEAACQGAKDHDGLTIGIIPTSEKSDANDYCDIIIPSGMGEARNVLVVNTADVLISLHGKYGTISEMSFALKQKKPLISLVKWDILPEVITITDPQEAVAKAVELAADYVIK